MCVFVCVVLIHVKLLQSLYLCVTFPTVPALFLEAGGFTQTHTSSKPNLDEKYCFAMTQVQFQSPQDQVQLTAHFNLKHIKLMRCQIVFYKTCSKTPQTKKIPFTLSFLTNCYSVLRISTKQLLKNSLVFSHNHSVCMESVD